MKNNFIIIYVPSKLYKIYVTRYHPISIPVGPIMVCNRIISTVLSWVKTRKLREQLDWLQPLIIFDAAAKIKQIQY